MSRSDAGGVAVHASFRDPSGYVFRKGDTVYRHVNSRGIPAYRNLMDSGLYDDLVSAELLIPHQEVEIEPFGGMSGTGGAGMRLTLRPEQIGFISYPYEWCFSLLKDAALTTLAVQQRAISKGMWLKDASAYNIQFHQGRPVFIDTLSLAPLREGAPWPAYKQFCQHFLAPLALMANVASDLGQLLRVHIDGIPLPLASTLLPASTNFRPGLFLHIHQHAAAQRRFADGRGAAAGPGGAKHRLPSNALPGIIDSLEGAVSGLHYRHKDTEWGNYYANTNYSDAAMAQKKAIIAELFDSIFPRPTSVWDLGANNGEFSRIASRQGIPTISWDIDPVAVEQNYVACRRTGERTLLPLLQNLTNPSPNLGWAERERDGFAGRGPADTVFAFALIHHLAITNNVPMPELARYFASLTSGHLLIEWVSDKDSQVRRLCRQHDGPIYGYRQEYFESAFAIHFEVLAVRRISGSERTLYLMKRK